MARAVVWGGMLIVTFAGIFFGLKVINADQGQLVGYAVGAADDNNECELQVAVSLMTTAMDAPPLKVNGQPDWEQWLDTHFILTDDAGNTMDLRKGGYKSKDINELQAGTAEFIALGKIQAGMPYTLTYVPVVGEPEQYTHTVTGEAKAFRRTNFEPSY